METEEEGERKWLAISHHSQMVIEVYQYTSLFSEMTDIDINIIFSIKVEMKGLISESSFKTNNI
tara:strand:+ start:3739 stop:3930 length:192 start_codon:yes stop_codon:yes gene_type:complete